MEELIDVIGAEKENQLSMPIRMDAAETIQVAFELNAKRSKAVRKWNAFYVQRLLRERKETRERIEITGTGLRFVDRGR